MYKINTFSLHFIKKFKNWNISIFFQYYISKSLTVFRIFYVIIDLIPFEYFIKITVEKTQRKIKQKRYLSEEGQGRTKRDSKRRICF